MAIQLNPKPISLLIAIVAFVGMLSFGFINNFWPEDPALSQSAWIVACLTVLMAILWVTEAIPIPVTALLPLVVLPLSHVQKIEQVAVGYSSKIVLLLMGGFIIAKSVERWGLHERIALHILSLFKSPSGLIAGFMLTSALLSMWISNTATTIMLMPIALSVGMAMLGAKLPQHDKPVTFIISVLLAVAYGASIGGLATPIGTPTNLIVMQYLQDNFDIEIGFGQWMSIGLPVVLCMLPACWLVLAKFSGKFEQATDKEAAQSEIKTRLTALGEITAPESRVLMVFSFVAFLWVFGRLLKGVSFSAFGLDIAPFSGLTDHVTAIFGAILVFLIPSGSQKEKGTALLEWETAQQIPWGVLLLFGGGLALAGAIKVTGLALWLGGEMSFVSAWPIILIIVILVSFVIFSTELTSNVATASALLPVVGAIAMGGQADPLLFAIPVAMAASCAFMLPIATGPNAIVFASNQIPINRMIWAGFKLNLLGIILITGVLYLLVPILT